MSTSVSYNGSTYTIPAIGDASWGSNVSNYLVALASGSLTKAGGAFTLTGEVDFGATYALKAAYLKSKAVNPAAAGVLRLAKADVIGWRNNANGADLALGIDASDFATFNNVRLADISTAQTFQNKTMSGSLNTFTNLPLGSVTGTLGAANGGTGVANNAASTLAISGSFGTTLTVTGVTGVTLPTSGTLATLANSEILTNKTISGSSNTLSNISLTSAVTNTLPVANGGTGQTTAAASFKALAAYSAKGQLPGYDGAAAGTLAVGADGTVLTADAASTYGIKWGTALANPMTTAQDLIVGGAAGAATRLPTSLLGDVQVTTPSSQAYTVTAASPGVFTVTAHGYLTGDKVYLTATQNGFTANTTYYVYKVSANTFQLCSAISSALSGSGLTSSGTTAGVVVGGGLVQSAWTKGRYDGVQVGQGYVGEQLTGAAAANSTTSYNTAIDATGTVALTAGTWLLVGTGAGYFNGTPTAGTVLGAAVILRNVTDSNDTVITTFTAANTATPTIGDASLFPWTMVSTVILSTAKTYKIQLKTTAISGSPATGGIGSRSTGPGLYAIRIG